MCSPVGAGQKPRCRVLDTMQVGRLLLIEADEHCVTINSPTMWMIVSSSLCGTIGHVPLTEAVPD